MYMNQNMYIIVILLMIPVTERNCYLY